jgi:hypothetical protein
LSQHIAGIFVFISFLLTVYAYFINDNIALFSGIFAWLALFLLFQYIAKKILLYVLIAFTCIFLVFALIQGFEVDFQRAILVNQHLLTLLIGVGFLRLIATPKQEKIKQLPVGKSSFLKTYLGIHLFGSVINLSSLILVADKLYKKGPLSQLQLLLLTRAFSSDAYWSPFFVAFAAALTYAPNLSTPVILSTGLMLAFIAFLLTYQEVQKNSIYDLETFQGYPIHFETLYIPVLLALLVLVINHYFPHIKVIMLISLFSVLLTIALLPMKTGLKKAIETFGRYITEQLPLMRNELALFLIAGVFGVMVSSLLSGFNIDMPFSTFDGIWAAVMLLVLIVLSFVGIHPIISIAVIGNWMPHIDHTLLAMAFLMSWSTAVSTSPFSGLNLTIQARYNIKAIDIFKVNISYAIKMYVVCAIVLMVTYYYL